MMISRRSKRSATIPAGTTRNRTGRERAAAATPRTNGEPVSSRISQPWATVCIQVPVTDTSWPSQKIRKSRSPEGDEGLAQPHRGAAPGRARGPARNRASTASRRHRKSVGTSPASQRSTPEQWPAAADRDRAGPAPRHAVDGSDGGAASSRRRTPSSAPSRPRRARVEEQPGEPGNRAPIATGMSTTL